MGSRGEQARLPILLIGAMSLTFAAVAALANWTTAIPRFVETELARQRDVNGLYLYDGGYTDDADYTLLGQIPHDDYSRGGVYFIGDSQMRGGLMPWTLPPEERALIRNYAIGDIQHRDMTRFVRMLVEECGLLEAGGENTTIFLGISFHLARNRPATYVRGAFERHGLYTYSDEAGIHVAPLNPVERFLRLQRDAASRYLQVVFSLRKSRVHPGPADPWLQSSERLRSLVTDDWRATMREEVGELTALLDYLQARDVHVVAIIPPSGSWASEPPYEAAYRALVMPILASRNIPLIDHSDMLTDEEMFDGEHPTYRAQLKVSAAYRALAVAELERMGLLPGRAASAHAQ